MMMTLQITWLLMVGGRGPVLLACVTMRKQQYKSQWRTLEATAAQLEREF